MTRTREHSEERHGVIGGHATCDPPGASSAAVAAAACYSKPAASARLRCVVAVVSLLHEPPDRNSATRTFRGVPVLRCTLDRLRRAHRIASVAVMCWDDQLTHVEEIAGLAKAQVVTKGPRVPLPGLESITAARRWADGWRGGLMGTCAFDVGFHGPFVNEVAVDLGADAVIPVDPASGLLDPSLLDAVVGHAEAHPRAELSFAPAASGLCGPLLRIPLLERLAATRSHPGRVLHYFPDVLAREPLAGESCVPVATPVARTTDRFTLNSDRQIARIATAVQPMNGQLATASAEELVRRVKASQATDPMPREIVLELNTARLTRPVFWPGRYLEVQRPDLPVEIAKALFGELAASDEMRLTLAGTGDPLLSADLFEIVEAAAEAGLAVHVETDLLGPDADTVRRLAASGIDVVSVHLPGVTEQTYAAVMGTDTYQRALENVQAFVAERAARGRGVPLLVPLFAKCRDNLVEMEPWYDQWLRALGCAAIVGPSDFAGQVPDVAVADMAPPLRRVCARLGSRMTVLCDGRIVSCEQDVLGRQTLGQVGRDSVKDVWQREFGRLREEHRENRWDHLPLCKACREWHRP